MRQLDGCVFKKGHELSTTVTSKTPTQNAKQQQQKKTIRTEETLHENTKENYFSGHNFFRQLSRRQEVY